MQTNPHFLFNAINTIYIQIDDSREAAKQTLHVFSNMLRYQLYECNYEKVSLEKELAYIQDYIALQKLRKDESYHIEFSYPDFCKDLQIAPFLLIPFIENMFKHVSSYVSGNQIEGHFTVIGNLLQLTGTNTKMQNSTACLQSGTCNLCPRGLKTRTY